jgi:hypothetical protein
MAGEIYQGKEPPGTHWIGGFVGSSIGPNALEKR